VTKICSEGCKHAEMVENESERPKVVEDGCCLL
jgi:hypothetical protein